MKIPRAKFLGSDGLFCFSSIANLAASRTLLQRLLACLNFTIDSEDLLVISINYGSSTSCWKTTEMSEVWPDTYELISSNLNPLTKFTSSRSTEFKDILPWNISQMITKTIPISTKIVISHAMKQGILFWVYWKVSGNWATAWSEFPNGGKAIVETSVRRKK